MKIMKAVALLTLIAVVGCSFPKSSEINLPLVSMTTNLGAYHHGEKVTLDVVFENKTTTDILIKEVSVAVIPMSDTLHPTTVTINLEKDLQINPKKEQKLTKDLFRKLPDNLHIGTYGLHLKYTVRDSTINNYKTFFRIIEEDDITVFEIETEKINDVPIFKLDGGMSAEYIVEKSAENLTAGISHSWYVNAPGSGPNHVLGTPNFLEKSVNQTVNFYNDTFGKNTSIETVLVTTGFSSIPYISNALKAPVLPIHYLVSVQAAKEIQTILKTANDKGIASYATLSHDPSVPYAVSWIKLLELPKAYRDFIKQHKVKNVVILGATGTSGGETKAKQLLYDDTIKGEYADRSIYIMYPGTSPDDVKTLNEKIVDLKDFKQQDDFIRIADWESGINQKQLTNFAKDTKSIDQLITANTITAEDLGRLYALGGYSTLAFMHKNSQKFDGVKGVIFNPYLIAHPTIEVKKGFVPLLYWQLVGAEYTVYNMEKDLFKAIKHFYPKTNPTNLKIWLNSTRNFGAKWSANNLKKELTKKGYTNFIENDYDVDEVWDLTDKVDSPSELLFKEVNKSDGFAHLKAWSYSLKPLTIKDIKALSETFGGFEVTTK